MSASSVFGRIIAATTTFATAIARMIGKPVDTGSTVGVITDATFQAGANEYFVTVAIAGTPEGWVGT